MQLEASCTVKTLRHHEKVPYDRSCNVRLLTSHPMSLPELIRISLFVWCQGERRKIWRWQAVSAYMQVCCTL